MAAAVMAAVMVHQSCTGDVQIGDPSVEVAKIKFVPDELGGLQVAECLDRLGKDKCPVLPNHWECKGLEVSVRGDGSMVGSCTVEENGRTSKHTVRSAMPVSCRMHQELGCVQCVDSLDRPILDTCSDRTSLYTGKFNGNLPSGSGELQPTQPPPATAPPSSAQPGCNPDDASKIFEDKLNEILANEGFNFSYVSPRLDSPFTKGKSFKYKHQVCTKDKGIANLIKKGCDTAAKKEGFCYCWSNGSKRPNCRTARMIAKAISDACDAIPAACGKEWEERLWADRVTASAWLMKGSYASASWYNPEDGAQTGSTSGGSGAPRPGFNDISSPKGITSKGSPLVLDLNGDGIALTSPLAGVKFDLLGGGPVQTSWIKGADDALLALDLDDNGRIDGGHELFGEATNLGGYFAADGFQALAALDSNKNGLVEQDDLMFDQLVLWNDRNHDGESQPSELRKLLDAGVTALGLSACEQDDTDEYGNQLRLRSTFLRADGSSGPLVDVFFVNR
jgi:hypothetical protein